MLKYIKNLIVRDTEARLENLIQDLEAFKQVVRSDIEKVSSKVDQIQSKVEQKHKDLNDLKRRLLSSELLLGDIQRQQKSVNKCADSPMRRHVDEEESLVPDYVGHGFNDLFLDELYLQFENHFRGPRELVSERQKVYLPYAKQWGAGTSDRPILDLGCGRGEWLELLRENGLQAVGVDNNRSMSRVCGELGLKVVESDALEYLSKQPSEIFGAITGFHIIEHLPFRALLKLFVESYRVVKPGGFAIFETPNPENLIVGAYSFYADPTHLRPLPSLTVKFWLELTGWDGVDVLYLNEEPNAPVPILSDISRRDELVMYFAGGRDYAVICRKTMNNIED